MQKIIAFFALFLLFQTADGQSAKWVFKEKDGSRRIEIKKNETVEIVWRSDDPRSISSISADFLGIAGDSILLENSAGQAFSRPLVEARSIKMQVAGGRSKERNGKKTTGWTLILGGVLLWLIALGIYVRLVGDAVNSSTGTSNPTNAQATGCCLTSILGLAAIIAGIVFAATAGPKARTETIEQPSRNWTIKKVDIP